MAALKEAEEELSRLERAEGANEARQARANEEMLASLRLVDTARTSVPGIEEYMAEGMSFPEPQRTQIQAFWKMREAHYLQTEQYKWAKAMVVKLREEAMGRAERTPAITSVGIEGWRVAEVLGRQGGGAP